MFKIDDIIRNQTSYSKLMISFRNQTSYSKSMMLIKHHVQNRCHSKSNIIFKIDDIIRNQTSYSRLMSFENIYHQD